MTLVPRTNVDQSCFCRLDLKELFVTDGEEAKVVVVGKKPRQGRSRRSKQNTDLLGVGVKDLGEVIQMVK